MSPGLYFYIPISFFKFYRIYSIFRENKKYLEDYKGTSTREVRQTGSCVFSVIKTHQTHQAHQTMEFKRLRKSLAFTIIVERKKEVFLETDRANN